MPTLRDVRAARERIAPWTLPTPLVASRTLSRLAGAEILLKCENLQRTGSFKVRGALNRILMLSTRERRRGVVAASAGNHAQGVAYAGAIAGIRVRVVMPETAAIAKIEATRGYGAEVLLAGRDYAAAFAEARRIAARSGAVLVHAFDDPRIVEGQGTVGLELVEEAADLDAIVVPVGGGGLLAGIAAAIEGPTLVGAQAALASTLAPSLAARRRLERNPGLTIADGLATAGLGAVPWRILRRRVHHAVTVDEGAIAASVLLLLERAKLVVEGAAAVALAACLGPLRREIKGKKVAVVLSGGNIDVTVLDRILNLGLEAQGRVVRFATVLPDRPGALSALAAIVGSAGANIRSIDHDRGRVGLSALETLVTLELETRGGGHGDEIRRLLRAEGYGVISERAEPVGRSGARRRGKR